VSNTEKDITRLKSEKVKADGALAKLTEQMSRRGDDSSKARQGSDDREEEVKELKRVVTDLRQESLKYHKQVTARETQIDQLRARRYNLYMQARLEEISLPQVGQQEDHEGSEGSSVSPASLFLDDADDEDHNDDKDMSRSSSQASQATRALQTRQDRFQVDFSGVPKKYRKVGGLALRWCVVVVVVFVVVVVIVVVVV
jgi:DNA repair exonuclease SbcCD ATPase subunit